MPDRPPTLDADLPDPTGVDPEGVEPARDEALEGDRLEGWGLPPREETTHHVTIEGPPPSLSVPIAVNEAGASNAEPTRGAQGLTPEDLDAIEAFLALVENESLFDYFGLRGNSDDTAVDSAMLARRTVSVRQRSTDREIAIAKSMLAHQRIFRRALTDCRRQYLDHIRRRLAPTDKVEFHFDAYFVLGVAINADADAIERAYHQAWQDVRFKVPRDEARGVYERLDEAWRILRDPNLRRLHDAHLEQGLDDGDFLDDESEVTPLPDLHLVNEASTERVPTPVLSSLPPVEADTSGPTDPSQEDPLGADGADTGASASAPRDADAEDRPSEPPARETPGRPAADSGEASRRAPRQGAPGGGAPPRAAQEPTAAPVEPLPAHRISPRADPYLERDRLSWALSVAAGTMLGVFVATALVYVLKGA